LICPALAHQVSEAIDKDSLTCADYSILVENIPRNATDKEEWLEFFNKQAPIHDHNGKVAAIVIALNNGKLLAMSEHRTSAEDKLDILRAKLRRDKFEDIQKAVKKQEKAVFKMRSQMGKMRARTNFKAQCLFVTFESEVTRMEMEDEFKGILARKGTLFRNRYRLKVRRAPEPDVILWENLQNRGATATIRACFMFVASSLILIVSAGLIISILSAKQGLGIEV
jgi:hypothetical protein